MSKVIHCKLFDREIPYEGKLNKAKLVCIIKKEYGLSLVEYAKKLWLKDNPDSKCPFCGGEPNPKVNWNMRTMTYSKHGYEKDTRCFKYECSGTRINGRSKEFLVKIRGMSQEEADEYSLAIGRKSGDTAKSKRARGDFRHFNGLSKEKLFSIGISEDDVVQIGRLRNKNTKEHWISKGIPEERAKRLALLHSAKNTHEYLMYIEGYSKDEAEELIEKRKEKFKKSLTDSDGNPKPRNGGRSSEQANDFLVDLEIAIKDRFKHYRSIFESKNEKEWYISVKGNIYYYDFVLFFNRKKYIVEFHGSHCHYHPSFPDSWRNSFTKDTPGQYKEKYNKKKQAAIDQGFEYIEVWDFEANSDKINNIIDLIGKGIE